MRLPPLNVLWSAAVLLGTDGQVVGGKNPDWNKFGHERMGWSISAFDPATP
jgi:hypothetical protein